MSSSALARGVRLGEMWPGMTAALSFSGVDILVKVVFASGMDVMTMVTLRGILVVSFMFVWLRMRPAPVAHTRSQQRIAWVIGVLVGGTTFGLMMAISLLPVSIAILAYFAYPLLTGIAGGVTGLDRLGWPALLTALAAFLGLALMLGAEYHNLSGTGIAWALAAAGFRVVSLLMTRAYLNGTDPRLTTWYSMLPSTLLFLMGSFIVGEWHMPGNLLGWAAFIGGCVGSTLSQLLIYLSTNRVGPFRTAFIMNLEPLVTTIFSMLLLGEWLTPPQALGAMVMLVSLCVFQFVRAR
ncbi:MAG: DMT family transporter [Acetobacteraceae bacterium]|nr:DMT family transporter [Acetobacteraceae bacterium]